MSPCLRSSPAFLVAALLLGVGSTATGCKSSPRSNPEFDDAARYLLRVFDSGTDADRAYGIRQLEEQTYLNIDLEAGSAANRSVTPAQITEDDIADLEHPDVALDGNLPVAVGMLSAYLPADLATVVLLEDQTPVEPSSPDLYARSLLDGADCWGDRSCTTLRTVNDVERKNILYTVQYQLWKDYRWVDLGLPDPADVPDGDTAVNPGEPRWAIQIRSYVKDTAYGDGVTIWQSYAIEVMVPRDCGGFVRDSSHDSSQDNRDGGDWVSDSCGGGAMRLQAMWSQTELGTDVSDEIKLAATRTGMSDGMEAYDDWLDDH